ncbi:MAG: peptidylprolyl isomerase [Planctomycetota bacterium]|jgi:peptidyl-prolyl cis-trans isomerase B (cyclophilin B)
MTQDLQGVTAELVTSAGTMKLEFFPDKAPGHVQNFVELAEKGFYDGLIFHRVIKDFMIQGGCPDGTGMGGPGYQIKAEFNDVHHGRGVLSMARSQDPDSAGSQFFICHADAGFLDGQYTAFGQLTDGDDTLEAIATAETGRNDRPTEPVKIEKVTVHRPA